MLVSPFTFYRGAAAIMAADLAANARLGHRGAGLRRCPHLELRRVLKGRILFAEPFSKAGRKTSLRAVRKLTERVDGEVRFRNMRSPASRRLTRIRTSSTTSG
ncbi:MAG: DUF2252 family protein [Dermatophilaceae bacterium]